MSEVENTISLLRKIYPKQPEEWVRFMAGMIVVSVLTNELNKEIKKEKKR